MVIESPSARRGNTAVCHPADRRLKIRSVQKTQPGKNLNPASTSRSPVRVAATHPPPVMPTEASGIC